MLLIRYCLALRLLLYGFVKVFPLQFPANSLVRMSQEFGSFSPMGVVWSFMGASAAYSVFAGLAELTGGILLCFRRTTLIGAMCAFGVMTNVAALNYCYDIPVKLHSTHLLLMAVFLLAPDAQRMADVFLFNRAAQPADLRFPEFAPGWQLWVSRGIWMVMVGSTLIGGAVYGHTQYSRQEPRPPLYGLYQVEDGAPAGWLRVVIEAKDHVVVRMRNGSTDSFFAEYDAGKQTLELNRRTGFASLQWSHPDKDLLELTGTLEGEPVKIRLRRIDGSLLQRSRGFHWVQEFPFNR